MADKKTTEVQEEVKDDKLILENDTGSATNATDAGHAEDAEVVNADAQNEVQQEKLPVTPQDYHKAGYDSFALDAGGLAYVSPWGLSLLKAGSAEEAGLSTGGQSQKVDVKPVTKLKADADQAAVIKAFNDLADKFNKLVG